ncbi:uncharacterized protein LOC124142775 [Haliotis rufescens]|uniref:uncharacterized protein LOC124142775 n=1 Tax=Haliotis rufescens TaxID=6454 RepID=UPI00201E9F1E|nr:uncharacterized protein LOC124142775 [Haliotis rufescens]
MEPPIHCLYKKCKYTDKTAADDDISFVPFPKPLTPRVRKRVEKWLYACGRSDIPVSFVEKHYDRCYVCCTHFIGSDGPTKLCPDPICFLRDEPSEDVHSDEEGPINEDQANPVSVGRARRRCCVPGCTMQGHRKVEGHGVVSYHSFPTLCSVQRRVWANRIGREEKMNDSVKVCSLHFSPEVYDLRASHRRCLKRGALPTLLMPTPKSQPLKSSQALLESEVNICNAMASTTDEGGDVQNATVCCVKDCGSVSGRDRLTTFYPIPQDDDQLQELWRDALKLGTGFLPEDGHVCSKHFISGFKSDFPPHPDYTPSILPSSSVEEVKALRNTLRDFESGNAVRKMKYNCKSLQQHWFECGFNRADLKLGMKRVKAVKRAHERIKRQEHLISKAKRQKIRSENKRTEDHGSQEIKQEPDSEFEQRDDEFVIENERAEEYEEDCDDLDLSVVKQEPMSEHKVDMKTEDSQNWFSRSVPGSSCRREEEDMEDPCSKDATCAFTVVRTDGKVMMSEKAIKTEPEDEEYEKAMAPAAHQNSQDFCDEMLTVHFDGQKKLRHKNLGTASTKSERETVHVKKRSNVSEPNVNSLNQVDDIQNDRSQVSSIPVKTVVALNPQTFRSGVSTKTTFVVPRENIITLLMDKPGNPCQEHSAVGPGKTSTEFTAETCNQQNSTLNKLQESDTVVKKHKGNATNRVDQNGCDFEGLSISLDQRQRCSNSEVDKMSHISDSTSSDMLIQSQDVGETQKEEGPSDHEVPPSDAVLKKHTMDKERKDFSSASGGGSVSGLRASSACVAPPHTEETPDTHVGDTSTTSDQTSALPEPEDPNSKLCQTKKSLSKEYTFEKLLNKMQIQVTSSEMKSLLMEKLDPHGVCPSFQRSGRMMANTSVQSLTDKVVLHDLNVQCVRLNKEVKQHRKKLKNLTYDFLDDGLKVTNGNVLGHTGCYTVTSLVELYEYVSICLETPPLDDISNSQELILTLMKLRLGLHNYDLAFRFQVDPTAVPRILNKWISILFNTLSPLIKWPDAEPERTEHRNQRWRLLKLRYDLLMAYDGIDSMKDTWLMEQDVDDIIKICDVLNSFVVPDQPESRYVPIQPETATYFIEQVRQAVIAGDHGAMEKSKEKQDSGTNEDNIGKNEPKCPENPDKEKDEESKSIKDPPQRVGDDIDGEFEPEEAPGNERLHQDSVKGSNYAHQKEVDMYREIQLDVLGKRSGCKIITSLIAVSKSGGILIGPPSVEVEVETQPSEEWPTSLDFEKVCSVIMDDESDCMD